MADFSKTYLSSVYLTPDELVEATKQALYISFWTTSIDGIIGIILGMTLVVTHPNGLPADRLLSKILGKLINIIRSIPFIILFSLLALTTCFLAGTTVGAEAALVPLIFGVVLLFARQIKNALLKVDPGVAEAVEAMRASPIGITLRVYLLEGLPGIIRVSVLIIISVIGLTTMAGAVGVGGLGNPAISRGYNQFQTSVTIVVTLLILVSVFLS